MIYKAFGEMLDHVLSQIIKKVHGPTQPCPLTLQDFYYYLFKT